MMTAGRSTTAKTKRHAPVSSAESGTPAPIVGIGCSAGGLEALEKFLSHVPDDAALAIVVVQHLDPTHGSALPALLARHTSLRVVEAEDGMPVTARTVFVIPPNRDLSLLRGRLRLIEPIAPRGLHLPIDLFLRSLAEERHAQAIGVVLSGMGSDGVLGLRAIKEKGGLTLVQDPAGAIAESMPRSAIEAGVADIVAPVEALPARITAYLRYSARESHRVSTDGDVTLNALDEISILLRDRSGSDFSHYKTSTLQRRIERRMAVHQIESLDDYARHLRTNPAELDLLFKELLIGVTSFFRDPEVWTLLRDEVLPELFAQHPAGKAMRAWVAGCSTGEEAYSLAIVFREALEKCRPSARFTLQIYATDLDPESIEKGRKGRYPENVKADISPERLNRFFVWDEAEGFRVCKDIREMVVFATQNVLSDPPFTKLDLLSCRNLLIYFSGQLQKRLIPLFHYALNPGGILVLGTSETVGSYGRLFKPLNAKARLYTRTNIKARPRDVAFPSRSQPAAAFPATVSPADNEEDIGHLTDQLIQQSFSPAAVLVNGEGDILYFSGRTGRYLEPAAGKTNVNIHAMAREGLREALVGVLHKALTEPQQPILLKHLRVGGRDGGHVVDVTVQAIESPAALHGRVIVVFHDVPAQAARRRSGGARVSEAQAALMQELEQTRESLQTTHEEMQTTVEELKSSNEELQSTNEELQSANEELTTSKEELQSLNEELQTVNAELQSKVDDLTWIRNDMTNLLNSIEIATVFLDNELKLRRFTTHATKLFKLIPGDVGRPLSDIVTDLDYPELAEDAHSVLATLAFRERQVATRDGRWYRTRIMPYRTQDNVIDGVVITFIDITEIKKLESALRERKES